MAKRQRGDAGKPRTPINIDRAVIQRAALQIADEKGLDAVTMRNIAEKLNTGVMSLYHYIKTKDDLIDGLAEVAIEQLGIRIDGTGEWHAELERVGLELHSALCEHPGAVQLLLTRTAPPASFIAAADQVLALLLNAGLDHQTAVEGMSLFQSYVVGHSVLSYSHASADVLYDQSRLTHTADIRPGLTVIIEHLRSALANSR